MPYEVAFRKQLAIADREQYINECCVGGDQVSDVLLPAIRARYQDIQANQEDWGWFIWFAAGPIRLAVDIFCEDSEVGHYRIHLTSRVKKFPFGSRIVDTPELEALKTLVLEGLEGWVGSPPTVERLDANYDPLPA